MLLKTILQKKITDVFKTLKKKKKKFVDDYVSSILGTRSTKCADHRDMGLESYVIKQRCDAVEPDWSDF